LEIKVKKILLGMCTHAIFWISPAVHAGPMGFKESVMSMGDFSTNWREGFVNYALTSKDAMGTEAVYMRSDDQRLTRDALGFTYTRLAKRWNMPEAQANVWLFGGVSAVKGNDFEGTRTMLSPGIQFDYETTRLYVATTARLYRAKNMAHDYASVRAGFSFYEVNYDDVQPWFILETRRMRGLSDKAEITPMLRLIHHRYFIEAGVSTDTHARFNFMFIF
jgi:hypothetical protein